jgi:hypothetical protein
VGEQRGEVKRAKRAYSSACDMKRLAQRFPDRAFQDNMRPSFMRSTAGTASVAGRRVAEPSLVAISFKWGAVGSQLRYV